MTNVENQLTDLVTKKCSHDEYKRHVLEEVSRPNWEAAELGPYHWAKYVPRGIRELWDELSPEARLIAYLLANDRLDAAR
jgi:hypothetical protein